MGMMNAMGMADMVNRGDLKLDVALRYHLSANHYPPVPATPGMVDLMKRALRYARSNKLEKRLRLPDGVRYKGSPFAPVWAVVEQHHLEAFLN